MKEKRIDGGRGRRSIAGTTLLELVVALVVLGVFLSLTGALLVQSLVEFRSTLDRADALTVVSIARHVLGNELRSTVGELDLSEPRSIRLRAFRGTGLVCTLDGRTDSVRVAYRGDRSVDPAKDSAWVLSAEGGWVAVAVEARLAADRESCPSEWAGVGTIERWRLSETVRRPIVARIYEAGTYVVNRSALRYRRGVGGAQPLTPPRIDHEESSWRLTPGGARLQLTLLPTPDQPLPPGFHLHPRRRPNP